MNETIRALRAILKKEPAALLYAYVKHVVETYKVDIKQATNITKSVLQKLSEYALWSKASLCYNVVFENVYWIDRLELKSLEGNGIEENMFLYLMGKNDNAAKDYYAFNQSVLGRYDGFFEFRNRTYIAMPKATPALTPAAPTSAAPTPAAEIRAMELKSLLTSFSTQDKRALLLLADFFTQDPNALLCAYAMHAGKEKTITELNELKTVDVGPAGVYYTAFFSPGNLGSLLQACG